MSASEQFEIQRRGVGDGWQSIIEKAHDDLIDLLGDYDLLQIKEKFGGLRFYMMAPSGCDVQKVARIRSIIETAEREAWETCEVCGEPGTTKSPRGWYKTLCDEHYQQALV